MMVPAALVAVGLLHVVNGAWMLLAPMSWYLAIPGVSQTGPINHHFVADIGLAFIASGAGLIVGARKSLAAYAVAGAVWPLLHALLHMWGWAANGIPRSGNAMISEIMGVVVVGVLGALVAVVQARKDGVLP